MRVAVGANLENTYLGCVTSKAEGQVGRPR